MKDTVILDNFGLMDYSLLLTIAFNPQYVEKFPDRFEKVINKDGKEDFAKPYMLKEVWTTKIEDKEIKLKHREEELKIDSELSGGNSVFDGFSHLEQDFLVYMSGFTKQELEDENRNRLKMSMQTRTIEIKGYNFEKFQEGPYKETVTDEVTGKQKQVNRYIAKERDVYEERQKKFLTHLDEFKETEITEDEWKALLPDILDKEKTAGYQSPQEATPKGNLDRTALYKKDRHMFMSEDGMYLYFLGIIDYLQDWNWNKWGEHQLKSQIEDGERISAVPPEKYSLRYINFMQDHVLVNQRIPKQNTLLPKNPEDFRTELARLLSRGKLQKLESTTAK